MISTNIGASVTYSRLAERFPAEAHKTKRIGGTELVYVTGEMVFARLNEALGYDGWSFEVKDIKVLETEVWALGRLTVYAGERTIVREQAGGQIINRNRSGEIIELSNDIKGAVTDAAKKCATLVGVGLYLYDQDERREVQQEMAEAKRPKPPTKPIRPAAPRPEPVGMEQVRAAAMVGGAAPAEGGFNRSQAVATYRELAPQAIDLEHPKADKIAACDPDSLSDEVLAASVEKLKAWVDEHLAF